MGFKFSVYFISWWKAPKAIAMNKLLSKHWINQKNNNKSQHCLGWKLVFVSRKTGHCLLKIYEILYVNKSYTERNNDFN